MRWKTRWLVGAALAALTASCSGAGGQQASSAELSPCESLKLLEAPDVRMTSVRAEAGATPLCKVDGVIGREINFSVWMPDKWNGRFLMSGNGGLAGFIPQPSQDYLARGYAIAGTDTGHVGSPGDGSWSPGEPERQLIVRTRYAKPAEKSLFFGCSDGGRQALQEAQRYPEDFDGILSGSPMLSNPQHGLNQVTIARLMFPNGPGLPVLSEGKLSLLRSAVLEKCDQLDGLKDGIVGDPPSCPFDPKALTCKAGDKTACLTAPELAVVEAVYNGVAINGKPFSPGYSFGGELPDIGGWGWHRGGDPISKSMLPPGVPSAPYGIMASPRIDGTQMHYFDKDARGRWVTDVAAAVTHPDQLSVEMSPTNPDLSAFRARGGKLLMFHGWGDTSIPPRMTLNYVEQVYAREARARDDVRLFMEPGVLHCGSVPDGPPGGRFQTDYVAALDAWASGGAAPDQIEISFADKSGARKVCAWPTKPVFKGSGDGKSPEQFACE
jgi:feruloyl esterase